MLSSGPSACAYLQIMHFSERACLVLVFHFMFKSSPKWSELASRGMTEQVVLEWREKQDQ